MGMSTPDANGMQDPGGPEFLSFGTNVTTVMDGDTVKFVAVLTHPDGLQALAGGHLTDATGMIQFDAFVADQQGSYSVSLTWDQIYTATKFQFVGMDQMTFVAEFFDTKGRKASKSATLTLACMSATAGTCMTTCRDFAIDRFNCGGCGKDCSTIGSNDCAQGGCNYSAPQSSTVMSCADICAAEGATCSPTGGFYSAYRCATSQILNIDLTCTQLPPAADMGCPFFAVECRCNKKI